MDLKVDKKTNLNEKNTNKPSLKTCHDCHTTKTPLWRGGPGGPQSLCNACGIKYHKRKRQLLGLSSGKSGGLLLKKKKRSNVSRSNQVRDNLKMRFMALGNDLEMLHRFKEEERAAILLMALSCGSAYA